MGTLKDLQGRLHALEDALAAVKADPQFAALQQRTREGVRALVPDRFLVCHGWSHMFGPGDRQTNTRWVMDRVTVTLVVAQYQEGNYWYTLAAEDADQLLESLRDANDLPEAAAAHGVATANEMPMWAAAAAMERSEQPARERQGA